MPELDPALAPIFPRTAELTRDGHLALGGCDAVDLAIKIANVEATALQADLLCLKASKGN
ncbi:MAG: hypothetical protein IH958_06710 [Chloroflexi bacterium]|nr:hypothetical protein [Chloroflexota bacterium]